MEIVIKNKNKSKKIDVSNCIVSLQGVELKDIINNLKETYECECISSDDLFFVGSTVLDEISIYNKYPEMSFISDVLICLGYDTSFFDKNVNTLSYSEKIILNILRKLSDLNKIVVFDNIFSTLDMYFKKKFVKLFELLKENGYVIFITGDVNDLYKYSDYSVVSTKTSIKFDSTDDIYTDVAMLKKNKLDIPVLSYITYRAKEDKGIKLFYSKDIRDIIKDIYKHV